MLLEEQQNYSSSQTMHRSFAVTMSVAKKTKKQNTFGWRLISVNKRCGQVITCLF